MAEITGKKIKQLEAATTINTTDDFIIETTPSTGSPVTKRAAASVVKEMINRELNSALGGFQIFIGKVDITPKVNTPTAKAITFSREFASAPVVITCPASSAPGTAITGTSASDVTKSGCNIYLTRSGTTTSTIMWVAIGPAK